MALACRRIQRPRLVSGSVVVGQLRIVSLSFIGVTEYEVVRCISEDLIVVVTLG